MTDLILSLGRIDQVLGRPGARSLGARGIRDIRTCSGKAGHKLDRAKDHTVLGLSTADRDS